MIDLTVPISASMATWPDDPGVVLDPVDEIARGATANVSRFCFGSHTGTHVDPPCHFIPGGKTVDQLPLGILVGPAIVLDLRHVAASIGAAELAAAGIPTGTVRVLLQTRNSRLWDNPAAPFTRDYVHVTPDGAEWLVANGVRLVGIDYLSIEAFGAPGHPVHHTLLGNEVVVVEGLDLREAPPGRHELICLPLKVEAGDGAPARAILR